MTPSSKRVLSAFFTALAIVVLTGAVFAQVTGRISGTVTDQTGAVVAGATVEVMLSGGARAVFNATTSNEGLFNVAGVPAGAYELIITAQGYKKQVMKELVIRPGQE